MTSIKLNNEGLSNEEKRPKMASKKYSKVYLYLLVPILILGMIGLGRIEKVQGKGGYIYDVREIETAESLNIQKPVGLAYSSQAGIFEVMDSATNGKLNPTIAEMTTDNDLAGNATIVDNFSNPLNIAFNGKSNSLYHLNQNAGTLDEIPAEASGKMPASANVSARFDIKAYGLSQAEGMTFNPADGTLYLLDPAGKRMVRITPDANGNYDSTPANSQGRIQRIDLKSLASSHLRGIAFNPSNGHLYVVGPKEKLLFEITDAGALVDTYDLSEFTLRDPGAMVFAPSGDSTDDPAIQDLFIADTGQSKVQGQPSGPGQVLELSITAPTLLASLPAQRTDITQVHMFQTSIWKPPSPDPMSVTYRTDTKNLFITDSEVDEMTIWQGANVFQSSTSGTLQSTCNVLSFSKEPAGSTQNPNNHHLFISDDGKKKIFEIDLGLDDTYCTSDDKIRQFDPRTLYGDADPEGMGFGEGKLFVSDGKNAEVYAIDPGGDGIFGTSDDQWIHWDTNSLGIRDPEGIDYNPQTKSIYMVGRRDTTLVETSTIGTVLNIWNLTPFNMKAPSGVGIGPGSIDSTKNSIYVSARGVDNNANPNENDGKVYEYVVGQ